MATRAARGRGVPLARACLGRRPGRCSPPGLLGRPRLTSPGRRGCGCRRGPGPAEGGCGGELGRPGGWTPRGSRARAQLSESAGKLRGAAAAAAARSAARAAGASQRRLHGPRGRRASFAQSPAPGARGHGGAAAAAGVPGAPGRPSLHRGSPRAHWPRRGDHPGRRPLRPPPSRPLEHGKGRREVAPPRAAQPSSGAWRTATTPQPYPGRPSGRRFHPTACAGWGLSGWGRGRGPEGKGAAASLSGRTRGSVLLAEGCGACHSRSLPRRPRQSRPSGDRESPLTPGYFPHHQVSARD